MGIRAFELKAFNKFEAQVSHDGTSKAYDDDEPDDIGNKTVDYQKMVATFLDALVAQKPLLGNYKSQYGRKMRNLELLYCPNMPGSLTHHLAPTGEMQISTSLPPKKLVELLQEHGKRALELAREESNWEGIRDFVQVRLGLKMLTVDYTFFYMVNDAVHKSRQAFKKLQQCADSIRGGIMSGLVVAVSDHYGVSFDGTIYIKWDFQAEDLVLLLQGVQQQQQQHQ